MFAPLVAKVPISPSSKLMLQRSTLVAQRSGDIAFEHGHTLHRSVGKQAAPILLAQHIGSPTENECHDQAEEGVKGAAQQPLVASLDFSKISIYPRNQAEQSQKRSPLSLPQLVSPRTSAIAQAIHEAIVENSGAVPPTQDALSDALALVRMRDDACADRAAHLLGAQAFAFGNQILFRHGNYEPDTERGRALIVHELTHVVHQTQTGYFRPQRLVGGDVLSVQFTHAMAEAMTNEELSQQILLLRSHLQSEPDDAGAAENLAVLESVAYSRQAVTQQPPESAAETQQASTTTASSRQALSSEEQHSKFWWWLHSKGLALTKHENAELLRRAWGPQGGVVITDKDGDPIDVNRLSDDDVIALNKQLRERPVSPPLVAAAAQLLWPLACDATGKVHGPLPGTAAEAQQKLQSLSREELEQSAEELEKSIATRKAEQLRLGEEGIHRARISQEEDLLRAIKKKLSGS